MLFMNTALISSVSCFLCVCVPNDKFPMLLLCQGTHINQFPFWLDENIKQSITQMYITDTFIYCLPEFKKWEYENLEIFGETHNIIFNCAFLESWILFQTETVFNMECDDLPIPTFSPSISIFSPSINVSESVSTITEIPGNLSFPITDLPMTSLSPITNERITLMIILTTLISVLIILPQYHGC